MDDGSKSWQETLAMARLAAADGTKTIVVTPHQLGAYAHNSSAQIRQRTRQLANFLHAHQVPLQVLPGADVRIEAEMVGKLRRGTVLTLADHGKHVLLELPHELCFQLHPLLHELRDGGMQGILSHPERNRGLMARPRAIRRMVADGCLMQVTAGSLVGNFGPASQRLAEWMVQRELVHFVASDAHGVAARRPRLSRAYMRVEQLAGRDAANRLFCLNPAAVVNGREVSIGSPTARPRGLRYWFGSPSAA
jgi:protein-tyrosine phosphatase